MIKVLFVMDYLSTGGVSSSLLALLNSLDFKKYCVDLAIVSGDKDLLPRIPKEARVVHISKPSLMKKIWATIMSGGIIDILKVAIRRGNKLSMRSIQRIAFESASKTAKLTTNYDVAIACMELWPTYYVAQLDGAGSKVAWVHTNYGRANLNSSFDLNAYQCFKRIVAVSTGCAADFIYSFPSLADRMMVIENIIDSVQIGKLSNDVTYGLRECNGGLKILTVARIDNRSKRIDRVLDACMLFASKGLRFIWYVIGDGPDLKYFVEQSIRKGVSDCLVFLGKRSNPYPYMRMADVFILLSEFEGKPIVVTEAHILGCPTIVTNYNGASEQVPTAFGKVIDNCDNTIADNLYEVLTDGKSIHSWQNNLITYTYSSSGIIDRFDSLCEAVVHGQDA